MSVNRDPQFFEFVNRAGDSPCTTLSQVFGKLSVLEVLLWISRGLFVTTDRLSQIFSRLRFGYFGEICPKSLWL